MSVKFYSDKTQKYYATLAEAQRAEFEAKEEENREKIRKERELALEKERKEKELAEQKAKAAERKADADKVEAARKAMVEAQSVYRKELDAFCKRWGSYHYTSKSIDDIPTLFSTFDNFWNLFT